MMPVSTMGAVIRSETEAETSSQRKGSESLTIEGLFVTLRLIERSVLPRILRLDAGDIPLFLDVANGRLQIAPRTGDYYATDDGLAQRAPALHRILKRRKAAVRKAPEPLASHRPDLLECAARTLIRHGADGCPEHHFEAAPLDDVVSQTSFSALDIYHAALKQFDHTLRGPVFDFFQSVKSRPEEAWLITRSGWVLAHPEQVGSIEEIRTMTTAAHALAPWAPRAAATRGPSLSFLSTAPYDRTWCVAADRYHVAQLLCTPPQGGLILSAWSQTLHQRS